MTTFLIRLCFVLLIYAVCLWALLCDGGLSHVRRVAGSLTPYSLLFIGGLVVADLFLIVFWLRQNAYVYFWDSSGYWTNTITQTDYIFNHSFFEVLKNLYASINNDDYNNFLPTLVAVPMKLLGNTYTKYVCINAIMFCIPTACIQALTVSKMLHTSSIPENHLFVIAFAAAICFPANYYALFKGYIDVGFVLFAAIAMYQFVDFEFDRVSISRNLAIAFMLILTWFSRRYTAYFIVGYVVALAIKAVKNFVANKKLKTIVINFLMIGGCSLGVLLIFFRTLVIHVLLSDYANMFSAYDTDLFSKINDLAGSFGYVSGLIIAAIVVLSLYYRKDRIQILSLLTMIVVSFGLFISVQMMDTHHKMILSLPVYLICMYSLDFIPHQNMESAGTKIQRTIGAVVPGISLLLMLLNFTRAFIPNASSIIPGDIWSNLYTPMQRDDIDALHDLGDYLNILTLGSEDTIYVTASSTVLNSSILSNLNLPEADAIPNLQSSCDVDLRDGFPAQFLSATYVVATQPTQLHLTTGQEVVRYLNELVTDVTSYIGRHFIGLTQFELDEGVSVTVYQKVSEFSESDLQALRDYYTDLYPDETALFAERIHE